MEIQTVEFDAIEFEGADGKIHAIRQCSLADREELRARLNQLSASLRQAADGVTIRSLYDTDKMFKHRADRALAVCGISNAWVSIDQMIALLFVRSDEEGNKRQGWIADLNFPTPPKRPTLTPQEAQTYEQVIAALSTYCEGMGKAIELAKSHPHGELLRIVKAKAELLDKQRRQTDKAYAEQCEKRESQAKARSQLEAMQAKLYGASHG